MLQNTKLNIVLLISITLLAGMLRFWQITQVPPSLYWDEVSQAYNAYSVITTGKDEHQEFLPFARFQAFGDYKAPVNIYLIVISMLIFGRNDFAVRFPSAFLGTLTVVLTYFLVRELFAKSSLSKNIALFSAFFLSISPWHIQLSRAAYEGNIATFFTVSSVFLFFYALNKRPWFLLIGAVSFVIAFYAFNAHRVFIPLFVSFLSLLFARQLLVIKRQVVFSLLISVVLLMPYIIFFQTPESKLRFQEVNIFSDLETIKKANKLIADEGSTLIAKLIHNRRVLFAREYIINYFDFFNPNYLFFEGDINPRFSHRFNGQLFLWILPFILVGIYSLYNIRNKTTLVLLGWILFAPIAAAVARETPHALRSETFIPVFEIIAAVGISFLLLYLNHKAKHLVPIILVLLGIISIFSVVAFWHNYTVHNPKIFSADWQYGYKDAVEYIDSIDEKYARIYFTTEYGRPYIYVAWYGKIAPDEYWSNAKVIKDSFGFYNVLSLGKYEFVENPPTFTRNKVLYVFSENKIPKNSRVLKKIYFLNGHVAFVIAESI